MNTQKSIPAIGEYRYTFQMEILANVMTTARIMQQTKYPIGGLHAS